MYTNSATLTLPQDVCSNLELALHDRIGEGKHRVVYQLGGLAIKVLKPSIQIRLGPYSFRIPTWLYALYRNGLFDLNTAEHAHYQHIIAGVPTHLKDSFAEVYNVIQVNGTSMSICELVRNYDGAIAKTLAENGQVSDTGFWKRYNEVEKFLLSKGVFYTEAWPNNISVKVSRDGSMIPVLFDYDLIGLRSYPLKIDMVFKSHSRKKVKRRFEKIRKSFQPKIPSETSPIH